MFCGQIARKFLPDAEIVGWDFGRPKLQFPQMARVFVMDLPYQDVFESVPEKITSHILKLIDHHKTSLEKTDSNLTRYCIDGVAACRLAWQFFTVLDFPAKDDFQLRRVKEPYAITLAGEYDIWDHVPSNKQDIDFQFGLDANQPLNWCTLFQYGPAANAYVSTILQAGFWAKKCSDIREANIIKKRGFDLEFEGYKFLALNTARCNSNSFQAGLSPQHYGCLAFYWNGSTWVVSLYGNDLNSEDIDLSLIAKKWGGGGHKQACGFQAENLPWIHNYYDYMEGYDIAKTKNATT